MATVQRKQKTSRQVTPNGHDAMTSAFAFATQLGWTCLCWRGDVLTRVSFGHESGSAAFLATGERCATSDSPPGFIRELAERIQDFANGQIIDFSDVQIDTSGYTRFKSAVVRVCRRIPRGQTMSYGELASQAGAPRAARAVGNVMAANRFPLIVPCHRVVASASLGGFSARDGLNMKRRLLRIEGSLPE